MPSASPAPPPYAPHGEHVAAVDGGGSRTSVALAKLDGTVLGIGASGPANFLSVDGATAERSVREALAAAYDAAGIHPTSLRAAAICVAGVGLVDSHSSLERVSSAIEADFVVTASDVDAAWAAAFPQGGSGAIIIAGTGAVVIANDTNGTRYQSGGWGYIAGDEGSGYWIGRQGLASAQRADDGRGPATAITDSLLKRLRIQSMSDLRGAIYTRGIDRRGIADLAPVVFQAADSGDAVAQDIIKNAAAELASAVTAVVAQMGYPQNLPVGCFGSIWRNGALSESFREYLSDSAPQVTVLEPPMAAIGGAVLLALRAAHLPIDNSALDRLELSLREVLSKSTNQNELGPDLG